MLAYKTLSPNDYPELLTFITLLYEHENIPITEASKNAARQLLKIPSLGKACFIQIEEDRVRTTIGYYVVTYVYSLEYGGRCAFLDEFLILPEYRGQGYGKQALKDLLVEIKQNGFVAVHLEANHENTNAVALYERVGFVRKPRYLMTARL